MTHKYTGEGDEGKSKVPLVTIMVGAILLICIGATMVLVGIQGLAQ